MLGKLIEMPRHGGADQSAGRVLVVDDEAPIRNVLRQYLEREGYRVRCVPNGAEALQVLGTQGADVVLLDLMMPGVNGLTVCQQMRAKDALAHIPILILTGSAEIDVRRRALQLGADDFLSKPCDESELLARVRNGVRIKRYADSLHAKNRELEAMVDERTQALQSVIADLQSAQSNLKRSHEITIRQLSCAAEFRDNETGMHLERMSHFCELIGLAHGMSPEEALELRIAAPMHDVGKIGIPDSILLKPGKLTDAEMDDMRRHAEYGYRILSGTGSPLLDLAAEIAYTHHEKWDGGGYPRKLAGEEIPLCGRISAIADVFDALTSKRCYKRAWSIEEAKEFMESQAGKHFDPRLLALFFDRMDQVVEIRARYPDADVAEAANA